MLRLFIIAFILYFFTALTPSREFDPENKSFFKRELQQLKAIENIKFNSNTKSQLISHPHPGKSKSLTNGKIS